jgi:ABC-type amino acid transport substrate-binding protein
LGQTIARVEDLYGKRVLTVPGSTSAAFLDNKLIRYRAVPDVAGALDELAAGRADAVVYDVPILRYRAMLESGVSVGTDRGWKAAHPLLTMRLSRPKAATSEVRHARRYEQGED